MPTRCARPPGRSRSPTHYDVERTITSLGIGEALVTVLSPKGVPTPLAATRLLPPDSRMAPLTESEIAALVAASPFAARYGQTVDRESAHEIITARLVNARAAAAAAAAGPWRRCRATADAPGTMTPDPAAARDRATGAGAGGGTPGGRARARRAGSRGPGGRARAPATMLETGIRTAGRVVTSSAAQSLLRGVFGTIFGSGRRR